MHGSRGQNRSFGPLRVLARWSYDASLRVKEETPQMMRRISTVITLTFASLVVTATAAMAQTSSYPISPTASTVVKGESGTNGGTAFTGSSQIPLGTLMIVALVLAGVAALFVARRRAARFAG